MPLNLVGKLHRTVYISNCPENAEEDFVLLLMKKCGAIEAWDVSEDGKRITVIFQSINSMSNALLFNGMTFLDATSKIVLWKASEKPPLQASSQLAITSRNDAQSASSHKRKRHNTEKVQEEWEQIDRVNKTTDRDGEHDMNTNDNDTDDMEEKEKEEVRIRRVTDRAERRAALHNALQTSSTPKGVNTISSVQGTTANGKYGSGEISHGITSNDYFVDDENAYHDKMKELCYRQLRALCTLTANSLNSVQKQISELREIVTEQQQVELQIQEEQLQEQQQQVKQTN